MVHNIIRRSQSSFIARYFSWEGSTNKPFIDLVKHEHLVDQFWVIELELLSLIDFASIIEQYSS